MDQIAEISLSRKADEIVFQATAGVRRVDSEYLQVEEVPIASLFPGFQLRAQGTDQEHIDRLAEIDARLPPIIVDRRTMRVIDGLHRMLAALAKGQETIDVTFFEGPSEDAFLCAVAANVAHGLPLTRADRKAAAARVLASHPRMSDRAVAQASGLGSKTVAAIRRTSLDMPAQLNARIGRDGKIRPVNSTEGRLKAAETLAQRPDASLREVARIAGISPATVSDVRKRIAAGELPVTTRSFRPDLPEEIPEQTERPRASPSRQLRQEHLDPTEVLEKLLRDPSLRHKQEGRHLLRLLQQNAIGPQEWGMLTQAVPPHYGALVVKLARQYADIWRGFAQDLDERVQSMMRDTSCG